ncbi:MAG TPA: efflux transporter outer membrane subunit [Usitatibacter sp.]|nr:efflux transporter outer membrane subunit [Usitatibacter sp.]
MRRFAPIVALMLAGCALQPPPTPDELRRQALPNTAVPPAWTAPAAGGGDVTQGWLATFNDPALEALVREAVAYNYDLQVAAARVEAAEASARAAGAALYPQLNLIGRGGGKSGDGGGLNLLGLFANWELDLWGRVRAGRAQAGALYDSTVLDAMYARQSIAALVAKSWFLAREAAVQGAIAAEMVASSESLVGLSRDRQRVGNADDLEVATAEASVLGYRDVVLQADVARQNALRAVEILAGRYPSAHIDAGRDLPLITTPIPAGLPSQLLERRPDVRAAERRVAAAFHATQAAQAARLPRIALTAGVNGVSSELVVLKETSNPMWSVGATLMAPLFSGGALEAQVDIRNADQKAAIAEYGRIGSRAFGEVENALAASFNLQSRADILGRAVSANENALGFARVRYDVGSGDQRGVQNQLLALHAARTTLVHVQAERLIQRVNLYLALGGGFE